MDPLFFLKIAETAQGVPHNSGIRQKHCLIVAVTHDNLCLLIKTGNIRKTLAGKSQLHPADLFQGNRIKQLFLKTDRLPASIPPRFLRGQDCLLACPLFPVAGSVRLKTGQDLLLQTI